MPTKPTPEAKRLIEAVADAAKGASRRRLQREHGISERLARELARVRLGEEEFRTALIGELRMTAAESVTSFRRDLKAGRVPSASKMISAAIAIDKIAALSSAAATQEASKSVTSMVNLTLSPDVRAQILLSLSGPSFRQKSGGTPDSFQDAQQGSSQTLPPGAVEPLPEGASQPQAKPLP